MLELLIIGGCFTLAVTIGGSWLLNHYIKKFYTENQWSLYHDMMIKDSIKQNKEGVWS